MCQRSHINIIIIFKLDFHIFTHSWSIRNLIGGESVMSLESLEANDHIFSVAQTKEQRSLSIMTDKQFIILINYIVVVYNAFNSTREM